jgi:A/G-specific adenine glycosylase
MVSEFMLQQTTVTAVEPKYRTWLQRFPTVCSLANAEADEVMVHWSGLGYYQRARRLHQAARRVVERGGFPTTLEGLKDLPGFGPYTAAAVASICFGRPELSIDTNVVRVLYRYFALKSGPKDSVAHKHLREKMRVVLGWVDPGELNQSIMELGASLCAVRSPNCQRCPLHNGCLGRVSENGPAAFPVPERKKPVRKTSGTAFVLELEESRQVLLVRGTSLGLLRDLYQPPFVFQDEPPEHPISRAMAFVSRELKETPVVGTWQVQYGISGRRLEIVCRHYLVPQALLGSLVQILESHDVQQTLCGLSVFSREAASLHPVSTLTRTTLKRWLENL